MTISELKKILCEGFFPDVEPSKDVAKRTAKAVAEFGLPYEQEPAVTRHIGRFLEKHREDIKNRLGKEPMPDLVLFNGGSLKPRLIQERIRSAIRAWFLCDNALLPLVLENCEPDLSVALGASYYGLVKQGRGVRVGSGSPRSYYIGVASAEQNQTCNNNNNSLENFPNGSSFANPSSAFNKALCIVERGLDEGSVIQLPDMEFEVITNKPVAFNMFSSSFRSGDKSGDLLEIDETLTPMTPLQTVIKFGKKGEISQIPVRIEPEYTEMGTLSMWCRSSVTSHRWKLQFQLRETTSGEARENEVYEDALVEDALALIASAFSTASQPSELTSMVKRMEQLIDSKKNQWPLSFLRTVADYLIDNAELSKNSPEHEIRWLNLTGFCIRPGFGDAFDEDRIRKLWKIYLKGCCFPKGKQNAVEWWIFCRRIAGGLTAGQQRLFFQDVSACLPANSSSAKKKTSLQEMTEIWMALANMERLLVKDKIFLARKLLPVLKPGKVPRQLFWVLSRLGARELLYGSVDRVVSAKEVENWIKKLQKIKWTSTNHKVPVILAVSRIMRKTGDRTRDVTQDMIDLVLPWLDKLNAPKESLSMVKEIVPIASFEESAIFGESLPQGLILKC